MLSCMDRKDGKMLDFNLEQHCYGCGACADVCPKQAITMEADFEGFLMPKIDEEKCIHCGLCEKKCVHLNMAPAEKKLIEAVCKAAFRTDDEKRLKSASGGIAAILTEEFVRNGDVVVGCSWTENLVAKHIAINSSDEAWRLQSSKYVQSDMTEAYDLVKSGLNSGHRVLFIGTPCQTAAIRNVFGNPDNLYLVGLICGGVPSPKVWKLFKQSQEKRHHSKMIRANFRSKGRYGWNTPVALYEFENGKKSEKLSFQLDDYVLQYLYGVFKRNSCYQCGYKGDAINADVVLGDYWGSPEFRDQSENKGVSAILCLTQKGESCIKCLNEECQVIDTTLDEILHRNQPLIHSVGRGGQRKEFFETLDAAGYLKAAKQFGGKTNPIKYYGMCILDRTGLFELVKRRIKG